MNKRTSIEKILIDGKFTDEILSLGLLIFALFCESSVISERCQTNCSRPETYLQQGGCECVVWSAWADVVSLKKGNSVNDSCIGLVEGWLGV